MAYHLVREYLADPRVEQLTLVVQTTATEAEVRERLGSPPSLTVLHLTYYPSLQEIGALLRAVRAIRASDLVHFNEFPFRHIPLILLARIQERPRILTLHGVLSGEVKTIFGGPYPLVLASSRSRVKFRFPRGADRLLLALFRLMRRLWSVVVTPSQATASRAASEDGFDPSRVTVIPNGVGVGTGSLPAPHAGPLRLLFVGNLEPVKGPDVFLAALRQLQDRGLGLEVGIVGDGSLLPRLRDEAASLTAHRFTFHGRQTGAAVEALYRWCDVVVLPSRYDSFPGVLLEAMAAGRPVVASRVGGIPEIARHGRNAFLVDPTPEGLADGIARIAGDSALRAAMAEANLTDVRRYTWPGSAHEYLALYESLRLPRPRVSRRKEAREAAARGGP